MAQQVTVTAKGLYSSPNQLGEVPDGALSQADNVVISKDGVIEPRPGFESVGIGGGYDYVAQAGADFFGAPGESLTGGVWSADTAVPGTFYEALKIGGARTVFSPEPTTVREAVNSSSMFLVQPALDMSYALAGVGTALPTAYTVAYRMLWKRTNADGTAARGAPSGRLLVSNAAGTTQNVTITFTNPVFSGAGTYTYEVYRSVAVATATLATLPPSDELQKCYEGSYAAGATGTFTDILPESLLQATIYTAPSQRGAAAGHSYGMASSTGAEFRGSIFLGNITERNIARTTLVGAGAPSGIQIGDTVTFANGALTFAMTGAAAENIGAAQFLVSATGVVTTDIELTAQSMVRVYNRGYANRAGSFLFYDSGTNDQPGIIGFTASTTLALVTISSSRATAFSPAATSVPASTGTHLNRIIWSNTNEPEHFEPLSFADVGSPSVAVTRVISTRDAVFAFKDDGAWRITGSGGAWDIQPLDPTAHLLGARAATAFENAVYGVFESGIGKVSEGGVEIISGPIASLIATALHNLAIGVDNSVANVFAAHDDARHRILFWFRGSTHKGYWFDSWTRSWTAMDTPTGLVADLTTAAVNDNDGKLYLGNGSTLYQERRGGTDADYTEPDGSGVPTVVKWSPRFGGNPGAQHKFREVALHFRSVQFTTASIGFSTDVSPAEETITLTGTDYGVNVARGPTVIRALVPLEKSRGSQLFVKFSHANAGMKYELEGLSVVFSPGSTRVGR